MVFWILLFCLGCLHRYSLCICQYLVFCGFLNSVVLAWLSWLSMWMRLLGGNGEVYSEKETTRSSYTYTPGLNVFCRILPSIPKKNLQHMWTVWRKIETYQYNCLGTDSSCCIHPWYLCSLKLVMSYEVLKILRCHDIMSVARKEKREKKFCVHHRCHQTKTETKNGNMDFCSNFMRTSVEKDFRALPKLSLPKFWWWWWNGR